MPNQARASYLPFCDIFVSQKVLLSKILDHVIACDFWVGAPQSKTPVTPMRNVAKTGLANSLYASAYCSEYNKRFHYASTWFLLLCKKFITELLLFAAVFVWKNSPLTDFKTRLDRKVKLNCQGVKYITSRTRLGDDLPGPPLHAKWFKNGKPINKSQPNVSTNIKAILKVLSRLLLLFFLQHSIYWIVSVYFLTFPATSSAFQNQKICNLIDLPKFGFYFCVLYNFL